MRNLMPVLISLLFSSSLIAQDTLSGSIGYYKTLNDLTAGRKVTVDNSSGYPSVVADSKFFFIKIHEDETKGNTGFMGPRYDKINRSVVDGVRKVFPENFQAYENDYLLKGKKYFLDEGFRYRLLIQSTFTEVYIGDGLNSTPKQFFRIVIEDLESGITYTSEKYEYPGKFVKKFTKAL